ncbi:MAG TPA: nitroreductase family protein [Candidatus Dormibacteraeota bacterium]
MAQDVFETVHTVMAVRQFQDREVPFDLIHHIVESGRLTASSMNLQPWHFIVVQHREHLQELGRMVKTGPYIADAAFAVVVAYQAQSRFGISDASRAIQSMVLTAWSQGIGSNWAGFGGLDEVRRWSGLPDSYEVIAVLPFGYPPEEQTVVKKKRKPLGEIASAEHFGTPLT